MPSNLILSLFMVLYLAIDIFLIGNYKKKIKKLQEENAKLTKQIKAEQGRGVLICLLY